MCGIVGVCYSERETGNRFSTLQRMMSAIRYRGPDESGIYMDDIVVLGHVRLSIIDLASGCQPIHNEDETLWIVYNGEVFNYVELREELQAQGHRFYTASDTEVVLHLYEQEGARCLERLNGQFAFAIWDSRRKELFLARDRLGIRPLHYALHRGTLIFASEIKSIFAVPDVPRQIDPTALDQIFTFWTVLPGRTFFKDVYELPPGHYLRVSRGKVTRRSYWHVPTYRRDEQFEVAPETLCEQIRDLLTDAVRIRLRADVPVGCYLSGGLDSSLIAALIATKFNADVQTFGIRFDQDEFDEGAHQAAMVSFLKTHHHEMRATREGVGDSFAQTLWHCEKPLLRTAPVPLFMLSDIVARNGLKVVLTGEGADEVFGGYNIFKEAKVRQFWARQPNSSARGALLDHLYGYVFRGERSRRFLRSFFARGLEQADDPLFSHALRWSNTSRIKEFFSAEMRHATAGSDGFEQVRSLLPAEYHNLDAVSKAQYLETTIFLSNYLLSSQGDRVAMAHSVEIRLPFLDHRLVDFMARVPSRWKLLGLNEKHILKKAFRSFLPETILARRKQPYRAPIACCLLNSGSRDFAMDFLNARAIHRAGLFDAIKVQHLVAKLQRAEAASEMDNMALAGILSAQIIHRQFVEDFSPSGTPVVRPDQLIDRRAAVESSV